MSPLWITYLKGILQVDGTDNITLKGNPCL